jgi:HEPN domain-containing protein
MNATVREWLDKAEGDFASAQRERRARKSPNHDSCSFHSQQCVEKLMKAELISRKWLAPKTHDLIDLSRRMAKVEKSWFWDEDELKWLNRSAVAFRYPGNVATKDHARRAFGICGKLRDRLRGLLAE